MWRGCSGRQPPNWSGIGKTSPEGRGLAFGFACQGTQTFYLRGEALLTGIIPLLWWLTPADYTTTAPPLYAHENRLWGTRTRVMKG